MKIKNSFIYDIIIFILILNISQASIFNIRYVPFFVGISLFISYLASGRKFNSKLYWILFIWLAINLVSALILTGSVPSIRIIIHTVNLLVLPYLLLSVLGIVFWIKFERIVYFLTFISIPLFILNIIFTDLFNSFWQVLRPITADSFGQAFPYWTSLFYVNAIIDDSINLIRNAGFMWEPGGLALIAIWGIVYNLSRNGNIINRRIIVYFIALATTLSTAGYLAIVFIVLAIYMKKFTLLNAVLLTVLMTVYFTYIYKLQFVSAKIDTYITDYKKDDLKFNKEIGFTKVNRLSGGYYALQETLKFPIGYGLTSKEDTGDQEDTIYGTNGLGSLLVMWGFPMFIYLIILTRRYIICISPYRMKQLQVNLLLIALLVMFFSNPISRSVLVYFIFITPLVLRKTNPSTYISPKPLVANQETP